MTAIEDHVVLKQISADITRQLPLIFISCVSKHLTLLTFRSSFSLLQSKNRGDYDYP